jgi:hypothetical protein
MAHPVRDRLRKAMRKSIDADLRNMAKDAIIAVIPSPITARQ